MAADLILVPDAEQDLADAYAWYERQRLGLGEDFLASADRCLQPICRSPELWATVVDNYRRAIMRRFPYAVFYRHDQDRVVVFCRPAHRPRSEYMENAASVNLARRSWPSRDQDRASPSLRSPCPPPPATSTMGMPAVAGDGSPVHSLTPPACAHGRFGYRREGRPRA